MSKTQRVKIIAAHYDAASDTVAWQVKLKNGKDADIVWLRSDFGATFGIDKVLPVSIVEKNCVDMVGKEVNLLIEPKPPTT